MSRENRRHVQVLALGTNGGARERVVRRPSWIPVIGFQV